MKHKRTKATSIPQHVRQAVFDRDEGICVTCGKEGFPNSHVIPRSLGGLGIEQNIISQCLECHGDYESRRDKGTYDYLIEQHMLGFYPNWRKTDKRLIYRKGQ
jgi:5-methylcytosine-specific restriction endonuclease McrA